MYDTEDIEVKGDKDYRWACSSASQVGLQSGRSPQFSISVPLTRISQHCTPTMNETLAWLASDSFVYIFALIDRMTSSCRQVRANRIGVHQMIDRCFVYIWGFLVTSHLSERDVTPVRTWRHTCQGVTSHLSEHLSGLCWHHTAVIDRPSHTWVWLCWDAATQANPLLALKFGPLKAWLTQEENNVVMRNA